MKTTTRENMSTVSNEGFVMKCKAVTIFLFEVVGPNIKPNLTAIALLDSPIHKYLFIR